MNVQSKPEAALSRYTYLNPDFMPDHVNKECYRRRKASGLAYDLHALLSTLHAAAENDNMGAPMDRRGIDKTLEIAVNMSGDLIDLCESVEADARAKRETDNSKSEGSARIQELFSQYIAISDAADTWVPPEGVDEDKEMERLFWEKRDRVVDELLSLPCNSAADFAAKLIVDTGKGQSISNWNEGKLWKEARELVGGDHFAGAANTTTGII